MAQQAFLLAEIPNFGRVFDCGECGNIHLTVGAVGVTLSPYAYQQLVTLLNTSASNFEFWMAQQYGYSAEPESHTKRICRDAEPDPS